MEKVAKVLKSSEYSDEKRLNGGRGHPEIQTITIGSKLAKIKILF
jgi:hypothetical protein